MGISSASECTSSLRVILFWPTEKFYKRFYSTQLVLNYNHFCHFWGYSAVESYDVKISQPESFQVKLLCI